MPEGCKLLRPYRVLDLGDERGLLCGKMLAELGADVIKVEPPGGDPARQVGPFYRNEPHPERSLLWFAYNLNKRSVTLDWKTSAGQDMLKKLAQTADFFVESFAPGYLDGLGLGCRELSAINARLIYISITPFGQVGPYRDYKASDLVIQALGGRLDGIGSPDRAPLRIDPPQAYLVGNLHAVVAALMALRQRHRDGLGQYVDVSMQEAGARQFGPPPVYWFYEQIPYRRFGDRWQRGNVSTRDIWVCADGEVSFDMYGGRFARLTKPLVEWMVEEGMAPTVGQVDWDALDFSLVTMDQIDSMERDFEAFILRRTKKELVSQAVARRFLLSPVNTADDIFEDDHLLARDFFARVEHPELGATFSYPGVPYRFSETPVGQPRRAPLIGEHSEAVFFELGASQMTGGGTIQPVVHDVRDREATLADGALSGLNILDFTWFMAGPLITECLADHGARVVRVESEKSPDLVRLLSPYKDKKPGINNSLFFPVLNSSKMSISLYLGNAKAREIVRRLVAWADVVTENFTPGTMKKWQLDYTELRKINPRIIMLSSSAYGQTGPRASSAGLGADVQARAGYASATGWPGRPSVKPHVNYTDAIAPWFAASAILAALDHRRRTGQGQYIELSQYETGLSFFAEALLDYSFNKETWSKRGNRSARACPHGAYPCRGDDRWCAITVYTEEEWQAFCQVLGNPSWARDGKFASLGERKLNEDELDGLVSQWTSQFTPEEAMTRLQRAGVAAGVVNRVEDILEDPQLKARDFYSMLECSTLGPTLHYGWPYKLSRAPRHERGAPFLGEHTHYVCTKLLGMPDEEFVGLMAEGVFA